MKPERGGRRPSVRRAVVFLPNGFTLTNLWCGIYAIVLSTRSEFAEAALFVVLGGIADALDGRVARATGTGSRFGEELDSLVDAVSFGLAPALIMYFAKFNATNWEWLFVAFYASCAVMRLARFNVEQAGRKKTHFHGLPSPAAGLTLASYYWFSQKPIYTQTVILFTDSKTLADLPWHAILPGLMTVLGALMISDVPYAAPPTIGFRSIRQVVGTLVIAGCVALMFVGREFIFPALVGYVGYGAGKWALFGLLGRSRTPEEIYWEEEPNGHHDEERYVPSRAGPGGSPALVVDQERQAAGESREGNPSRRRRRRRGRGNRPGQPPGPDFPRNPPE